MVISYRGEEIAEIRPIKRAGAGLEERRGRLADQEILVPGRGPARPLRPVARRPGALKRFLEPRE